MTLTTEKFASVFDLFACGIALVGADGMIRRCNRIFGAIVGREVEEIQHRFTFLDLTHPDDRKASELSAEQVKAGNIDLYQVTKRYVAPNGDPIPVSVVIFPLRAPDGRFRAWLKLVTDLSGSQRQRTLAMLQELEVSNARVRALLEGRDLQHLVDAPDGGE